MTSCKNISYCNYKKTKGYFVRVMWKGQVYRKLFKFSPSKKAALGFAKSWRDTVEEIIKKPRTERKITSKIFTNGITKAFTKTGGKKRQRSWKYLITACPNPGKLWRTSVSIKKHGDKKAFARAKQIRKISLENYFV